MRVDVVDAAQSLSLSSCQRGGHAVRARLEVFTSDRSSSCSSRSAPGVPGFELPGALALGVQLGAEEDRQVREPEPDEEDDDAAERAVGLVVGAEVGDVERERRPTRRSRRRPRRQPPGMTHLKPRDAWRSARRSRAARSCRLTTASTSTGHLAMSQAVTAAVCRGRSATPTASASGPVQRRARRGRPRAAATSDERRPSICSGLQLRERAALLDLVRSTFAARMNAPT